MTQALAILSDSLRELRSRSLFWVSLGISAVVAIALFGLISFNEEGWRVLWFATNESEFMREGAPGASKLMSWMFSGVFVFWWLSWGAIILAVVSTSSILPEFLAGGSIDITLAKPISRVRLFLLKVLGALLFVAVQTTISVLLAYVLLGVKVDLWLHMALLAIPLIVVQFFYLYAVSALVAVVTRSTVACLLVTVVFWVLVSLLQFSSNQMDSMAAQARSMLAQLQEQIDDIRKAAEDENRDLRPMDLGRISTYELRMEPYQQQIGWFEPWQRPLKLVETAVPKTGDVQKIIATLADAPTLNELIAGDGEGGFMTSIRPPEINEEEWELMQEAGTEGSRAVRGVDNLTSLGSSLTFSVVVLGIAVGLFVRKDF
jgi:ABC-type transport system involved in multi-copper enzyme maturation permease subunit